MKNGVVVNCICLRNSEDNVVITFRHSAFTDMIDGRRYLQTAQNGTVIAVGDGKLKWGFPFNPRLSGETDKLNLRLRGGYHSIQMTLHTEAGISDLKVYVDGKVEKHLNSRGTIEMDTTSFYTGDSGSFRFGGVEFFSFPIQDEYSYEIFQVHQKNAFPADSPELYILIPILIVGIGAFITTTMFSLSLKLEVDPPRIAICVACTLSLLSVVTDLQFVFRMFSIDHYLMWWSLLAIVVPFFITGIFMTRWYQYYVLSDAHHDQFVTEWLQDHRSFSIFVLVASFLNVKFMSIAWSRLIPAKFATFFRMPVSEEQQMEISKMRIISLIFQEVPMLVIQVLLLLETEYNSDPTTVTVTRIGLCSSVFFMVYTVLNVFLTERMREKLIYYQDAIVKNANTNLMKIAKYFSKQFEDTPILIHELKKREYTLRFPFADGSKEFHDRFKVSILEVLEPFVTSVEEDVTLPPPKMMGYDGYLDSLNQPASSAWRRGSTIGKSCDQKAHEGLDLLLGAAYYFAESEGTLTVQKSFKGRKILIEIPEVDSETMDAFEKICHQKLRSPRDYILTLKELNYMHQGRGMSLRTVAAVGNNVYSPDMSGVEVDDLELSGIAKGLLLSDNRSGTSRWREERLKGDYISDDTDEYADPILPVTPGFGGATAPGGGTVFTPTSSSRFLSERAPTLVGKNPSNVTSYEHILGVSLRDTLRERISDAGTGGTEFENEGLQIGPNLDDLQMVEPDHTVEPCIGLVPLHGQYYLCAFFPNEADASAKYCSVVISESEEAQKMGLVGVHLHGIEKRSIKAARTPDQHWEVLRKGGSKGSVPSLKQTAENVSRKDDEGIDRLITL